MRRGTGLLIIATLGTSLSAQSQTDADLAALEARLMARLERRIAEENATTNSQITALRVAFREAVDTLAKSRNELDHKALVAIDGGAVKEGVAVLEERAKARDSAAAAKVPSESDMNFQEKRQKRADEWMRIGALAFLDNTDRAIAAYQQALSFAPNDAAILDQLGELYMRQARWNERVSVGERLIALRDPEAQAKGYYIIAGSCLAQGQQAKAHSNAERCIEVAKSAKVGRYESRCLSLLAGVSAQQQEFQQAEQLATRALTIARDGGYDYEEGMALYVLGGTGELKLVTLPPAERRKALQDVDRIYEEVEQAAPKFNDPGAVPNILVDRARVAIALGDGVLAESRLRKALASLEGLGATGRISYVEHQLGRALVVQRRIDEAIPYFRSSVQKAREAKEPGFEAVALMAWAAAEAARANQADACRLAQESYRLYVQGVPEMRVQHQRAEQQMKQYCP